VAAADKTRASPRLMSKMFPVYEDWEATKTSWARSMLGIYCPIADWGGQTDAYRKIRDNAMYYINPEKYMDVVQRLVRRHEALMNTHRAMWGMAERMSERLGVRVLVAYDYKTASMAFDQIGPNTVIMIMRPNKGPGGLLKKELEKGIPVEMAHDQGACKVLTDSLETLYRVVEFLHGECIPSVAAECGSPDIFIHDPKDYVSNPKPVTLYQGVHIDTVVSDGNLASFETIACTLAMHLWSDEGGASHDGYKGVPLVNGERKRLMQRRDEISLAAA
jgi:(p)ppGpp synthase/HD superfamily hydrolase